ncbi:hypothetical protein BC939DRAFT_436763 [Gamsiella multidivaricata]|uniref:uncharacterized protein n=1 Tax=Gamsiella multidivaricata TaxID=101098 RepID=UPI00221ECE67|nr:uncharacterized protein BC939DRAFT_436763 [Gamsiella multidivaricata]KAI7831348.1 hypothetical protein BC939DRAFT_436763 [Gamsiella multidivaricata]
MVSIGCFSFSALAIINLTSWLLRWYALLRALVNGQAESCLFASATGPRYSSQVCRTDRCPRPLSLCIKYPLLLSSVFEDVR